MSVAKTDGAAEAVDYISLKDIEDLLCELERLGFVKRTGQFQNGSPVFVSTRETTEATERRTGEGGLTRA